MAFASLDTVPDSRLGLQEILKRGKNLERQLLIKGLSRCGQEKRGELRVLFDSLIGGGPQGDDGLWVEGTLVNTHFVFPLTFC